MGEKQQFFVHSLILFINKFHAEENTLIKKYNFLEENFRD